MPTTWTLEVQDLSEAQPQWDSELIPRCSESCWKHDGKRCRIMGQRPGGICEPAVDVMAELLNRRTQ